MTDLSAGDTHTLCRHIEDLGLARYHAKVLVALLVAGEGTTKQLADHAGVNRTGIYRILRTLAEQGLAEPKVTNGPTVWTSHGWDIVIDTLDIAAQERLHLHRAHTSRLRDTLARINPGHRHPSSR